VNKIVVPDLVSAEAEATNKQNEYQKWYSDRLEIQLLTKAKSKLQHFGSIKKYKIGENFFLK
jgi:hypothetical protein